MEVNSSEILFYGGIGTMILSIFIGILCFVIFYIKGKKIKAELEKEYGVLE